MRILALLTDGFGVSGGIGKFNRDLLEALCTYPETTEITSVPRLMASGTEVPTDSVFTKLTYLTDGINSDVAYLIVGDGTDRARLEEKARNLGLGDRVAFAGFIPEDEKVDHYRLADVYVMPSKWEGFGSAYLEAMACGIPVTASSIDGSLEAIPDETFGITVDPAKPAELKSAIRASLAKPKGVPEHMDHFSYENFSRRGYEILDALADPERPTALQLKATV